MSSLVRGTHAALFAGLFLLLSAEAQATTYSWTGAANASWSNAGNWSPNGVPANGDLLIFPAGAANKTNTNDLNGLELADILFNDNGYPGYTLGGNGIVLTHSLTGYATINLPIDVQANAVSIGNVQLNGALSGTGPITGDFTISGAHTYSGIFTRGLSLQGATLPNASVVQSEPSYWSGVSGSGTLGTVSSSLNPSSSDSYPSAIINTGNLTIPSSSSAQMSIKGATAGTDYGQINVTGSVTLGSNSYLSPSLGNSFIPSLGQEYVLISNDGTDAVSGTFWDKPEGTILTLNGYQFRLSYRGGDGNDVTLTSQTGPSASKAVLVSSLNPSETSQSVTSRPPSALHRALRPVPLPSRTAQRPSAAQR